MPFSRQQTRLATCSTFEPLASTSSRAVPPPTGLACAFAVIIAKTKTADEPGNQSFRAIMISCAVGSRLVWEEHASCARLGTSPAQASIQDYPQNAAKKHFESRQNVQTK